MNALRLGKNDEKSPPISAVDLFCGAGGLTYGLTKEGIKVNAGVDIDEICRWPFEKNSDAKFILKDIRMLTGKEVATLFPEGDIKIVVGCAPCQPFSFYNQGRNAREDEKWGLLESFAKIIEIVKPEIVSMENVTRLTKHEIYTKFIDSLKKLGSFISENEAYCPAYGVPQTRKRLVLLASTFGAIKMVAPFRKPDRYLTVRDAIGHLDPIRAGEISKRDPLHRSSALSDTNLKRIKASRPGGTWREWGKGLVADCHKKKSGKTYPGVYGRMEWDRPSPTITTQFFGFGNGRFGHPTQDRAVSLREGALLQSFPEDYSFYPPGDAINFNSAGRLIGNAVPVELGRAIARSILGHIEENHGNTPTI